jgi:eukaryotic-like serine/threonine-protein kinase
MKKKYIHYAKILGAVALYFFIFVFSVLTTMRTLIKGEELNAPDFVGKTLTEAQDIAAKKKVYLKRIVGSYDRNYKAIVVMNQVPSAGVRIKEKSIIKIFVPSEVVEVVAPNLIGLNLTEGEKLLRENDLIKRYISYIDSEETPVDVIIGQSYPSGSQIPRGTEIDILVSRGGKENSYIMPDLIGKKENDVLSSFERLGLKVAPPSRVSYPGVEPGIVVKQYPLSGYPINTKARISIEVSR